MVIASSRGLRRGLLGLVCVGLASLGVASPGHARGAAPEALVVLRGAEAGEMGEVVDLIEAAGGAVHHLFPPDALIGAVPAEAAGALAAQGWASLVSYTAVDPLVAVAGRSRPAQDAARAWNHVFAQPAEESVGPPAEGRPLVGDALARPEPPRTFSQAASAPPGAQSWQTSEYMMGSVVVSVVLLESDGAVDTSTEDWNSTRETEVASEVVAGLNWWVSRYPYAVAPLSFTYVYSYGMATSYEPISRPRSDQALWIAEALTALGHSCDESTYFSASIDYANDLRDGYDADWAFTVFVVDSQNDADNQFTDGRFAYAYLGGPFLVMTYGNDGWGIANMDRVMAHETGHIFQAGDEYCSPGYSCCDAEATYGYLDVQNVNCDTGVTCVMNNNVWSVCAVTQQQLGWLDSDSDGRPDILDTEPTVSLGAYSPDPSADATPTYAGSASVTCYANQQHPGADVTLNRIANVQYRIDGGVWRDCAASDGAFDEGTEAYIFTTVAMTYGTHTIEVRAADSSGNVTLPPYASDTLTVSQPHGLEVTAEAALTPICSEGVTQLTASASDSQGHGIASWSWTDNGAGGAFSPSAAVRNATYTAPAKAGSEDVTVTLTVTATCDGGEPLEGSANVEVVVHDFTDVAHDFWAADEIYACYRAGIVSGYLDGSYQPGLAVTRDQMAAYISRALAGREENVPTSPAQVTFEDMPEGNWAWKYVEHAHEHGIVGGYPDGLYHPEGEVDRGQMAVFVARATADPTGDEGLASYVLPLTPTFEDVTPTGEWEWCYMYVEYIASEGITAGYEDGLYHPGVTCARDQMATYIARAFELPL